MDRWRWILVALALQGAPFLPTAAAPATADQEMEVLGLQLDATTRAPALLLRSRDRRALTMYIGPQEAQAIAVPLQKVRPARPLTHDLLLEVIHRLDGRVKRVRIRDLRENTYLADLVLEAGDRELVLDARPSDAIALALREGAPIFAADQALHTPSDSPPEVP